MRAPRDACGGGVVTAIEACALRAREPAWRALAEDLLRKLGAPNHQSRARRAIAAALGEPLPLEAPDASVEARYAEAVVAGDTAGADAILAADPNAERRARTRAAERLMALGREADAIAFVTRSDVNGHARFDAFCVVARGIREPASLDGLIRARPPLPEWLEDAGAFAVAEAAARLGATRTQIEAIATRLDGITRREARLEAFGRLASACEPAQATELIARGLLTAPTERLFDPVAVAVASAHAWMRAGDASKAAEVLWETHRPVSRAWILAAEATHDLALARKLFDVAVGADALTWVTEAMRHDPLFTTPPFAPLGRMLAWLPDDEADAIEERLLTVLDVPHYAENKVASFIAGRVADPTAARRRPSWVARWPSPSPPLIAALAPWLVAEFAAYESMLGKAGAYESPARNALAVELARAGRVDEAIGCTQPLGGERASVLLSLADAVPSSTAALAKAARKIKKSRDTGDKATWYRVNVELALRERDLDGALALLGKTPLAYGVEAAVAVARAIAESASPSARLLAWLRAVSSAPPLEAFGILAGGLPDLIAVADADVRAEAAPIVASLFPRISARDAAAVEVVGLIGEVRAGRATVQALAEAVGRSGAGLFMERWFGRIASAIVRTPDSAPALRAAFALTQTWAPREAAQALSNLAAIMPPQSFVDTLRDARIPSGASRMTIQSALPTLARDPEAIAACVALHPDDEPLVRAALAWLTVARTSAR